MFSERPVDKRPADKRPADVLGQMDTSLGFCCDSAKTRVCASAAPTQAQAYSAAQLSVHLWPFHPTALPMPPCSPQSHRWKHCIIMPAGLVGRGPRQAFQQRGSVNQPSEQGTPEQLGKEQQAYMMDL